MRVYSYLSYDARKERQGNCDYDANHDTNLNGVWDEEEKLNNRTMILCDSNLALDDCFDLDSNGYYHFRGSTVKLEKTKMFLGDLRER